MLTFVKVFAIANYSNTVSDERLPHCNFITSFKTGLNNFQNAVYLTFLEF